MARIKKLSKNLINQIAAGEVIERPCSVVKELVENSIDAGSTRIEISVSNECRNIRIADNGCGIYPDDVYTAFEKHATSKISDEKDLWDIHTLGFRGEALASICSIAKIICTTKTKDYDYGVRVTAENSVVTKTETGCALGTVMEVENIFYNQPARLKFLKAERTEFSYIQEVVTQAVFANPEISFTLIHNGEEVLKTIGSASLLQKITDIYSTDIAKELKELDKTDKMSGMRITGYVSTPDYTRSSKKAVRIYVNSRPVKCPVVLKAIDMAYKNMLPKGKYPFVILKIDINPHDIDVNAHPTKKEIRWRDPNLVFNFVISAIDKALTSSNYSPQNYFLKSEPSFSFKKEETDDAYYISEKTENTIVTPIVREETLFENKPLAYQETEQPSLIPTVFQTETASDNEFTIIGQLKNTYILIETKDGLEIVDQHIADERYLFEKLKNQKETASQLLLLSDVIDLEPEEVELLMSAKNHLNKFGYEIEKISSSQIKFIRVPQLLSRVKPQEIASELIHNINGSLDGAEEKILVTTSCKAAVKAGEKLSVWQAEELIKRWKSTKNPEVCPHGRPISHFISIDEIAKFFDRQNKK
ncbi:MAG: DNA mismatch repair endonuclease MutL [Candidatus Gastranaerophilales bacterium]|nr:DNA mismatch repair endonuclease MutL [Candidatus Gastranaerophilales bacterium]